MRIFSASNDVPPAVSKRVSLSVHCKLVNSKFQKFHFHNQTFVHFYLNVVAPSVRAPSQLLGAPLGSDVQLNCQVEASPAPVSYWLKGGKLPSALGNSLSNAEMGQPRPEMLLDG